MGNAAVISVSLIFQRNVRDEQLEQRHKRITGAWDQDLAQVPELPKDWMRWIDKVAVRENFIFCRYKRGGAQTVIVPFVGKRSLYPGIHITIRKDAVPAAGIPLYSKPWGAPGIFGQKRTMLI